jgi:hypothetical protein
MIQLADISLYSILLPSGMVFLRWFYLPLSLRFLGGFILVAAVLEFVAAYYEHLGINNYFTLHIYTVAEHIFLVFYFRSLYEQKIVKRVLLALMVLFISFCVVNVFVWEPLDVLPYRPRLAECLIGMLLALYFFVDLFYKSQVTNLARYAHYWLASALLLYFAGTFFLNIVGQIAITSDKLGYDAYDIHSVLNIFLNIIFTIVLWMGSRALTSER